MVIWMIIPRGGQTDSDSAENATVPVLETGVGNATSSSTSRPIQIAMALP